MSDVSKAVEENVVLVGRKPVTSYVMAVMMLFDRGINEVVIKARGRAISRAVDTAEVLETRLMAGKIKVKDVKIGTESLGEPGKERNVSFIEIRLSI